ncbi:hypothetical protein LWI28_022439 [Acer negundo]|uniref:Uncharacterized protein n=1 Tax=Acer negundo TaxID=4023 RepID=A0AAD5NWE9_ACENE|nr:hypothetical protein LWI28_022439 [Acer negundo]
MESSSDTVRGAAAVAMEFPATDAATGRTQLHLKNSRGYLLGKRKAKGKSQGGRVCKKGTRNDACGGEQWIPIAQGLPWTTVEQEIVLLFKCLIKPLVKENTRPIDLKLHNDVWEVELSEFDHKVSLLLTTQNNNNNCDTTFKRILTSREIFEKLQVDNGRDRIRIVVQHCLLSPN